ncbi:sarcosine oxidase, gamma subunit family [Hartmannibacter diazotrophicus]|uniref:Sarcosine oxidase, gamma subunit family n=1 Tax=Hartmannibacter diazotrophicus TaxID=1482074 RepID=A0A2C9D044_9HYPH|nr:sarcosine oxidase subunit gamma family protein [Hartmannibacter diazotrophicus]SON53616.1 sarcosine oxidase, gamma subunit family [Hartmannibacter diazotrophicus]
MADLSARRSHALEPLIAVSKAIPAVGVMALAPAVRLNFRGRPAAIEAAGKAFGIDLPQEACRFVQKDARRARWLGPDEWMLTTTEDDAASLRQALDSALAGLPHSLTDVSHRSLSIAVTGPQAAFVINEACPLDLSLAAFPVGMCTRTVFGKAEIILTRTDETRFEIDVWRSFADYVWRYLEEARREFA